MRKFKLLATKKRLRGGCLRHEKFTGRLSTHSTLLKITKPSSGFSPQGLNGVANFYFKKEKIQLMLAPPGTQDKAEDSSHLLIYLI